MWRAALGVQLFRLVCDVWDVDEHKGVIWVDVQCEKPDVAQGEDFLDVGENALRLGLRQVKDTQDP